MNIPHITRVDNRPRLIVDDQPFLILGLQWDCGSCFSAAEMNPLFGHAARMGANTAALPTYWREVEPAPGRYEFSMVDERIRQAAAQHMRLVLLWFATWKNTCAFYAPDYIRDDPATYPPALDARGQPLVSLCPSAATTWGRDRDALLALMQHLRIVDETERVIMVQIENEPGILGSARCHCPECDARFAAGGWTDEWGVDADEAFSAVSIAGYIDRLAADAKNVYPLPMYVNVALPTPVGSIPGRYFSGGAVPEVLDLFRRHAPHLDLIAPDIYRSGYRDFQRLCAIYAANNNPLFIAEHSSSPIGRAERNVFYALGQYGAIGFDPWAIDSPYPQEYSQPLVDPLEGEWGPQAYLLRDSYHAIARAMTPIVEAQGTERRFAFCQEPAEEGTGWAAHGCDVLIGYHDRDHAARGMIIQQSASQFLLIGVGFSARFRRPRPDGAPVPIRAAEWGRYNGDIWTTLHPMRRERLESEGAPITLLEPGVARVVLNFS